MIALFKQRAWTMVQNNTLKLKVKIQSLVFDAPMSYLWTARSLDETKVTSGPAESLGYVWDLCTSLW